MWWLQRARVWTPADLSPPSEETPLSSQQLPCNLTLTVGLLPVGQGAEWLKRLDPRNGENLRLINPTQAKLQSSGKAGEEMALLFFFWKKTKTERNPLSLIHLPCCPSCRPSLTFGDGHTRKSSEPHPGISEPVWL